MSEILFDQTNEMFESSRINESSDSKMSWFSLIFSWIRLYFSIFFKCCWNLTLSMNISSTLSKFMFNFVFWCVQDDWIVTDDFYLVTYALGNKLPYLILLLFLTFLKDDGWYYSAMLDCESILTLFGVVATLLGLVSE